LPAPTPAAQQAAAAKKAAADAEAAKQKELLAASMESLSARWRSNASRQGLDHAPAGGDRGGTGARRTGVPGAR
jgi:hypothetical protein